MGAEQFKQKIEHRGRPSEDVFRVAVEDALTTFGNRGYTGTLAEKHEFVEFTVPAGMSAEQFIEAVEDYDGDQHKPSTPLHAWPNVERASLIYDDKWGAAVLVRDDTHVHIFGWASS